MKLETGAAILIILALITTTTIFIGSEAGILSAVIWLVLLGVFFWIFEIRPLKRVK